MDLKEPKVIVISGKAEAGKDLTAKMFAEIVSQVDKRVCVVHYADYLKFIASKYYGWDGIKDRYGRELLQYLGTDKVRNKMPDFWVKIVALLIKAIGDDFDYILIPDCRFYNEISVMQKEFPITTNVRIARPYHKNKLTEKQRNHPSETALDNFIFEYYIVSQSKEELRTKVLELIKYVDSKER